MTVRGEFHSRGVPFLPAEQFLRSYRSYIDESNGRYARFPLASGGGAAPPATIASKLNAARLDPASRSVDDGVQ